MLCEAIILNSYGRYGNVFMHLGPNQNLRRNSSCQNGRTDEFDRLTGRKRSVR